MHSADLTPVPLAQHHGVVGGGAAQCAVTGRDDPVSGDQGAPTERLHVVRDVVSVAEKEAGVLIISLILQSSESPFPH